MTTPDETVLPKHRALHPPNDSITKPPPEFRLTGFRHEYQGWNNCGPSTLAMALSRYGFGGSQKTIAPVLKPNPNDKNVGPAEMTGYAQNLPNFSAVYRVNGDLDLLRRLIANGFAVIVETWFTLKPNDGMGHYRLLTGYSDLRQEFFALDSYLGPNLTLPYAPFDADWRVFNRTYIVVYPQPQASLVAAIIGDAVDDRVMWTLAYARQWAEIQQMGGDGFAWHNLGSALNALGNPTAAAQAFDRARQMGLPWRMFWYQFGVFEAYVAVGRYQDVLTIAEGNLQKAIDLEESHYYRGRALEGMGRASEATAAYQRALDLNIRYRAAAQALLALRPPFVALAFLP
ncbi:MAG: C39 family peptidase [Chloroflexi bacterium]|nr:C39 family peptidase [Chloroflexota bacterium]